MIQLKSKQKRKYFLIFVIYRFKKTLNSSTNLLHYFSNLSMDLPSLIRRTVGRTSAQTLPDDVIFLILVYLGMAADVFSMHFFKRTPIPPSEQKTFIKGLVQSSNVEVLTLVINWWRIPRKWFDDFLILESIRGDHVKSLRVLLHFWGLHLSCRNKCTHLHTCYRKRKCDYLINMNMSLR